MWTGDVFATQCNINMFTRLLVAFCCIAAYAQLASAKFLFGTTDLNFGRALLAKRWKKCSIETRTEYVGKALDTIRGVKNSHNCCVECKKNPSCDRWTYLPGKWAKCSLFSKRDRSLFKRKARYHISGYASWRLKMKTWPKELRESAASNPPASKDTSKGGGEVAYEAPPVAYEDPNAGSGSYGGNPGSDGDQAYEAPPLPGGGYAPTLPPGFEDWGQYGDCNPFLDLSCLTDPISGGDTIADYSRLTGKTLYGRRLNSITPCIGNRASTSGRCSYLCSQQANCNAWTWTEIDCSWTGDRDPTGVCYLMGEVDEGDVFDAPDGGNFISGLMK